MGLGHSTFGLIAIAPSNSLTRLTLFTLRSLLLVIPSFLSTILARVRQLWLENVRLVVIVDVAERVPAEVEPLRGGLGRHVHLLVAH